MSDKKTKLDPVAVTEVQAEPAPQAPAEKQPKSNVQITKLPNGITITNYLPRVAR